MSLSSYYLVFTLDNQSYALSLDAIETVVRAVQLTLVPEAPEILSGLINRGGTIIPVLDIRKRFHLPSRDMEIEDRIIVSKTSFGPIAILVDKIDGVVEFDSNEAFDGGPILPNMNGSIEGVGIFKDHTVLIYDISKLFSIRDIDGLNLDVD
jgi:purine-binding chemotaxis protein CheW